MPTTMLAMTVSDWAVTVATVVLACATVVLALLTFRYTRHTDRIATHAREQVETIARLHQEDRRHRQRLAFHAVSLELTQIRDACEGKRPSLVHLPTVSWDTFCGEMTFLGPQAISAMAATYQHVRVCNYFHDRVVYATLPEWAIKNEKHWNNRAGDLAEQARRTLELIPDSEPS